MVALSLALGLALSVSSGGAAPPVPESPAALKALVETAYGCDALHANAGVIVSFTDTQGGIELPLEGPRIVYSVDSLKWRSMFHIAGIRKEEGYDGAHWQTGSADDTHLAPTDPPWSFGCGEAGTLADFDFHDLRRVTERGASYDTVLVTGTDGSTLTLSYDAVTHLLHDSRQKVFRTSYRLSYGDYRRVKGIAFAFDQRGGFVGRGLSQEHKVLKVVVLATLPDDAFTPLSGATVDAPGPAPQLSRTPARLTVPVTPSPSASSSPSASPDPSASPAAAASSSPAVAMTPAIDATPLASAVMLAYGCAGLRQHAGLHSVFVASQADFLKYAGDLLTAVASPNWRLTTKDDIFSKTTASGFDGAGWTTHTDASVKAYREPLVGIEPALKPWEYVCGQAGDDAASTYVDVAKKTARISIFDPESGPVYDTASVTDPVTHRPVELYFDPATHLLRQSLASGELSVYDDYRSVGGLMLPFKLRIEPLMTSESGSLDSTVVYRRIEFLDTLEPNAFTRAKGARPVIPSAVPSVR